MVHEHIENTLSMHIYMYMNCQCTLKDRERRKLMHSHPMNLPLSIAKHQILFDQKIHFRLLHKIPCFFFVVFKA